MFRKILMGLCLSLLFAGCAGSKKGGQSGELGSDIEGTALSLDAKGSDSGTIAGLNSINFDTDQARLSSTSRQLLAANAEWMKSNSSMNIEIEGHCDERGSTEYNLALGERRAKGVKEYLVNLGVPSSRITIISYGKEKPLALGSSPSDLSKNRRANFVPKRK